MKKPATIGAAAANFSAMFMVAVVFLDVIGSKFFNFPLKGSYELVAFAQLLAIALSGADTFLAGRHVQVEMLVDRMPEGLRRGIIALVTSLSLLVFIVMTYEGVLYGESLRKVGEVSGSIYLPLFPFAYVLAFSFLLMVLVLLDYLLNTFRGGRV